MELHTFWIFVPVLLISCIFYSIIRTYIYGPVSVAVTTIISVLNLFYYVHCFFPVYAFSLPVIFCVIAFLFAAWIINGFYIVYRQIINHRPSVALCLIMNVFLILTWNILILVSLY